MLLSAEQFADVWGRDRLCRFGGSVRPGFSETTWEYLRVGLPCEFSILCCQISFCALESDLIRLVDLDFGSEQTPYELADYWIIGLDDFDVSYAEICIDNATEELWRFDVELDQMFMLINTSMAHYVSCLIALKNWVERLKEDNSNWMTELNRLVAEWQAIDPEVWQVETNYWEMLRSGLEDSDCQSHQFNIGE